MGQGGGCFLLHLCIRLGPVSTYGTEAIIFCVSTFINLLLPPLCVSAYANKTGIFFPVSTYAYVSPPNMCPPMVPKQKETPNEFVVVFLLLLLFLPLFLLLFFLLLLLFLLLHISSCFLTEVTATT